MSGTKFTGCGALNRARGLGGARRAPALLELRYPAMMRAGTAVMLAEAPAAVPAVGSGSGRP